MPLALDFGAKVFVATATTLSSAWCQGRRQGRAERPAPPIGMLGPPNQQAYFLMWFLCLISNCAPPPP